MSSSDLTAHARKNREFWDAPERRVRGAAAATSSERGLAWGVWQIPEAELRGARRRRRQGRARARAAAPRSGRARSPAAAARPVGARQLGGAARAGARGERGGRARLPARCTRAPRRCPVEDGLLRRRLLRLRARRPSRTRTLSSPRSRGCCGRAACSRSAARRRSYWLCFDDARRTRGPTRAARPYFGMHRLGGARGRRRVQAPAGRVDPALPRASGFVIEDLLEVQPPEGRDVDLPDGRGDRPGRGAGRWSRSGRCGSMTLSDHVAAQPGGVDAATRAEYADAAERHWAQEDDHVGRLRRARARCSAPPGRGGQGRRRARLRHRLRLRVARAARRARRSASTSTPAQLDDGARDAGGARPRVPAARGERRGRCRCRTRRSTSPSPSTARRSGPTRTAGSPRRRGCCGPAGELVFLVNGTLADALLPGRGTAPDEQLRRARTSGCTGSSGRTTTRRRLPPRLRRLDQAAARERLRGRATWSSCRRRRARRRARATTALAGPEWARKWPSEEIWRARKPVSVPPAPPLLLASTSPQRRAILEQLRIPFDVVPPRTRSSTATRSRTPLGKARSVLAEAGDRPVLGVDTRSSATGRVYGKPQNQADAEAMLETPRRQDTRGRLGAGLVTPGWRGGRTTR